MTNVGTISVLITARTGQFTKGITQATAVLNTFARNAGRIAGAITAPTKNVEGLGSALSKNQSKLTDFGMTGVQAGKQMGQMGKGMGQAANAIGNNVGKAQNSLLSLQSFVGKISHYITFSIGVQMVMGIKRGFQSLIDTTIEFEKQAVRTAGVAGRLGGAFDKTVENLQQVSRTLGATTIFFATDAVNSMYDLASAGFDIADAMEDVTNGVNVMTPILEYAAAQQIELADATESVAKALKMFDEDLSATKSTVDTFTAAIANSFLTADKLSDALRYSGAMAHTLGLNLQETVAGAMALADAGLTGCYDNETKVLTNEGFKYFKDLNKSEKFLTLNLKTGKMEWQEAYDYIEYEVDRPIYRLKNRHLDLFVTPNHNMVVRPRGKNDFQIMRADEVYGKDVEYKLAGSWHNRKKNFKLPSIKSKFSTYTKKSKALEINGLLWVRFMAFYLAEGHYTGNVHNSNYGVFVSQKKNGKAYKIIKETLDKLPFDYKYQKNGQFRINNKQLHSYVKQFGRSYDKYIPEWVKENSKEYLEEFYRIYNLCDGDNQGNIYTCSPTIINDLIEILIKIGYGAKIYKHREKGEKHWIKDHYGTCKYDQYIIYVNKNHTTPRFARKEYTNWHKGRYGDSWGKSIKEEWKHYKGKVYCVTVPNHTLVVERNGKVQISGNSQAGQRLNMILTKLIDPTEEARRTLTRLGITIEDINPELHSFTEILYTLEAAGFKAADAATMFRARTAGAAAMLVNSADAVGQYIRVLNGASNITSELAEKQRDTLWGTLKLVAAAFQDVGIGLGQLLIPIFKTFASFLKGVVVPVLKGTVESIKVLYEILKPIAPALKGVAVGLAIATAAFVAYKLSTISATKSTLHFFAVLAANPLTWIISAIGAVIALFIHFAKKTGGLSNIMDGLSDVISGVSSAVMAFIDALKPVADVIGKVLLYTTPLGLSLVLLSKLFKDNNTELARARKFYDQISDEVKEYETSLGALEDKLEEQKRLEEEIIELQKDETASIDELSEKKGELKEVTEEVEAAEKDFLATTTELVREIQKLSEDLDIYANKFADIIEISNKITNAEADRADVEEEILDLQEEYNKAVADYGLTSLEATEILSKLADKEQEIIKIDKQIAELSDDKTEAMKEEEKQLNKLNSTERTYADIIQTVLDGEDKLSDLRVKKAKLAAKQNVLISTRNKFEGYFEEQVNALRDAETKLYEIEAKLYQLRYGQIDSYRDLFDAIASQGVASKEVIEAYRNMEISQGKAKKEQIDYSKVLERLSDANREKAMEWTQAYVEAVSDGATHSEAMIKANSELGYTLSNVSGVTNSVRKEIMEYAEAQGLANKLASEFRGTSLNLAEDLVNSGQASTEVAKAYYTLLKNSNDLEKSENELIKVEDDAVDASKDLIKTTGRLYNYYENIEGLEDDRTGIVMNMVDAMNLSNRAGETQADVLDSLNYFYGTNKESLEEFDEAEVVAALSAMRLADSLDYLKGKKLAKDDILPELPLDDWDTFISLAYETAQEQNVFDDLTSSLTGLDEDIAALVKSLSGFDDIIIGLTIDNPADEPTWWEEVKSTFQAGWKSILEGTDPLGIGDWWSHVTETLSKGWENITKGLDPLNIKDLFVGGFKWFSEQLINSANGIITVADIIAGGFGWLKDRLVDTLTGIIDIGSMITGGVSGAVDTVSGWFGGLFGEKGIVAAARGITETRGPTPAIIGENGAEAVVPLQGINRRNGLEILKRIIPEHFPELTPMESGSIVSSSYGGVKTNPSGPATVVQGNKEYHIHGDINVYGVQDVDEFMDELMRELEERKRMVE